MTIDLSEFRQLPQRRCRAAKAFDVLSVADLDTVKAALADSTITHASIGRWLKSRSVVVNADSLRIHRIGECCCRG